MEEFPISPVRDSERTIELNGMKMFNFFKDIDFLNQSIISFNENKNNDQSSLNKEGPIFKPNFKFIASHKYMEDDLKEKSIFNISPSIPISNEIVGLDQDQKKLICHIFHHDFQGIKQLLSG
jgi:hypothetical protein